MTYPPLEESWVILVKIALGQTFKITLKIIFNKKSPPKHYCSKTIYLCLPLSLCVRKGLPLSWLQKVRTQD